MRIVLFSLICFISLLCFSGCDKARIIDENKEIPASGWYYKNNLGFDFEIKDTNRVYSVYVNVRANNEYPFSNLFIMLHQRTPSNKDTSFRRELTLIDPNGKWLGKGLGDLFDFQIPVMERVRFKEKGLYHFDVAQNMRLDTLPHIMAAGMRVEDVALTH
jgi:gliding motility-associated lipoprotein GldH